MKNKLTILFDKFINMEPGKGRWINVATSLGLTAMLLADYIPATDIFFICAIMLSSCWRYSFMFSGILLAVFLGDTYTEYFDVTECFVAFIAWTLFVNSVASMHTGESNG